MQTEGIYLGLLEKEESSAKWLVSSCIVTLHLDPCIHRYDDVYAPYLNVPGDRPGCLYPKRKERTLHRVCDASHRGLSFTRGRHLLVDTIPIRPRCELESPHIIYRIRRHQYSSRCSLLKARLKGILLPKLPAIECGQCEFGAKDIDRPIHDRNMGANIALFGMDAVLSKFPQLHSPSRSIHRPGPWKTTQSGDHWDRAFQ